MTTRIADEYADIAAAMRRISAEEGRAPAVETTALVPLPAPGGLTLAMVKDMERNMRLLGGWEPPGRNSLVDLSTGDLLPVYKYDPGKRTINRSNFTNGRIEGMRFFADAMRDGCAS